MNILIVDDHVLFLEGFRLLLDKLDQPLDVHACHSGRKALEQLSSKTRYDLIILDLAIPDVDGITLLKKIKSRRILSPIVFVSASENIKQIAQVLHFGASGFIPKNSSSDIMLDALRKVLAGNVYVPQPLISAINDEIKNLKAINCKLQELTPRQKEVLRLVSTGYANRDIAESLEISETTVKTHITVIFRTLNVGNRVECIREAERLGII